MFKKKYSTKFSCCISFINKTNKLLATIEGKILFLFKDLAVGKEKDWNESV